MKITQKITALMLTLAIVISAFSFSALGAANVKGSEVAEFARQFEGCAYQSFCKGPDRFDCSGLVYYVLKNFGITFGAGTSEYNTPEKAKAFGEIIENMDDAKAGDIVIWNSHTGVYLGEGRCISAMNAKKGVIITEVEMFIDRDGVKNPYHFFVRPFDYIDETAGEDSEGNTEVAPGETPEEIPGETPDVAPDETPDETPDIPDDSASVDTAVNIVQIILVLFVRIAQYVINALLSATSLPA